jgi:hypothetical protein
MLLVFLMVLIEVAWPLYLGSTIPDLAEDLVQVMTRCEYYRMLLIRRCGTSRSDYRQCVHRYHRVQHRPSLPAARARKIGQRVGLVSSRKTTPESAASRP